MKRPTASVDVLLALAAAIVSFALGTLEVMSTFSNSPSGGLWLLTLVLSVVALWATRDALESLPEGAPGRGVAVATVVLGACGLAVCIGLVVLMLPLLIMGGA